MLSYKDNPPSFLLPEVTTPSCEPLTRCTCLCPRIYNLTCFLLLGYELAKGKDFPLIFLTQGFVSLVSCKGINYFPVDTNPSLTLFLASSARPDPLPSQYLWGLSIPSVHPSHHASTHPFLYIPPTATHSNPIQSFWLFLPSFEPAYTGLPN